MENWSLLFGEAYLFCFYTPFVLIFTAALIFYRLEGNPWRWKKFSARMRLRRLDKKTLIMTGFLLLWSTAAYLILSYTAGAWLARNISLFTPPDWFPGGLNPLKTMEPNTFLGVPMKGRYLFLVGGLTGWFFNIAGEELLFRGFLLPREEAVLGRYAWVFQGFLWAVWHVYWAWNVLPLLAAVTLPLCFVVSRSRNTWAGIIVHGTLNLIPFLLAASYL